MKLRLPIFVLPFFLALCTANAQTSELWSLTNGGGANQLGCVIKTDSAVLNYQHPFDFTSSTPGRSPYFTHLCLVNSIYYGMCGQGGSYQQGLIFTYDPSNGTYVDVFDFDGAINGSFPYGSLVLAGNGKLYGMARSGGANNEGILFSFDPAGNVMQKLLDFDHTVNGSTPYGGLSLANNGKYYGMTTYGGANGFGIIFSYDVGSSSFTSEFDFDGSSHGSYPFGDLLPYSNGKLYGMTAQGGAAGNGTLFYFDPATGNCRKQYDFTLNTNGASPSGSLILATNGKMYGMTSNGGVNGDGCIFKYNPADSSYLKIYDFSSLSDGSLPEGSLFQASDGNLYGLTSSGGIFTQGTLFKYDLTGSAFTNLHDFGASSDGVQPWSTLCEGSGGKLFGLTLGGGRSRAGCIFSYTIGSQQYQVEKDLNFSANGNSPCGRLLLASSGKIYGMTSVGGANGDGVIFSIDLPAGNYSVVYNFSENVSGSEPRGTLMEGAGGILYGTTTKGGVNSLGTIFSFDPLGSVFSNLHSFSSNDGFACKGSLLKATNGILYGLAPEGGGNGYGSLFSFNPAGNSFANLHDFDVSDGDYPLGDLIQAPNGKLYGLTSLDGTYFDGTLFSYDIAAPAFSKLADLDENTTGQYPNGSLCMAANGKLYGTTQSGGDNFYGTLFSFDTGTNMLAKEIDFDGTTNGAAPCDLFSSSNGLLYGYTSGDGSSILPTIYSYNTGTLALNQLRSLTGTDGWPNYLYPSFTEVNTILTPINVPVLLSQGQMLNISYFAGYSFDPGNTFTMQLSDSSGSFASPVDIGTFGGTTSGSVFCTIPIPTITGIHYRIRVIADQPGITGYDNGNDIMITQINTVNPLAITAGGIYPNPADRNAVYEFNASSSLVFTYRLVDQSGRVVLKGDGKSAVGVNRISLDVEKLTAGVYQFELLSDTLKRVEKLIVLNR